MAATDIMFLSAPGDSATASGSASSGSSSGRNAEIKQPTPVSTHGASGDILPPTNPNTATSASQEVNKSWANWSINAPFKINGAPADLTGSKAGITLSSKDYSVTSFPSTKLNNMMMIYFNETVNEVNKDDTTLSTKLRGSFVGSIGDRYKTTDELQQSAMMQKLLNTTISETANSVSSHLLSDKNLIREDFRTSNAIWLLYPQLLRFENNAAWNELNFDPNGLGLLAMASTNENTFSNLSSMTQREALSAITRMAGQGDIVGAASKTVQNTYNDMTFLNMQRRTFQLQWTLTPKSAAELNNVDYIIKLMRFHSHPDNSNVSNTGVYLSYPGTINISWMTWSEKENDYMENQWIPRISTCVVRNIDVDYSPNGQFGFFSNSGAPTQINLTITFTETHPLMKQDIGRGM